MAYGIDQCRICGKDIPHIGLKSQRKQEEAIRHPIMAEKEWRRRGFLVTPTRAHLSGAPAIGCCHECGLLQMQKKFKYRAKSVYFFSFVFVMMVIAVFIVTYLPH